MTLLKFFRQLKQTLSPSYQPLIEVRIFKDSILHNLRQYQTRYPKTKFAPVLKSNAYGHGLEQVAKILENQDIPFCMVDSLYEATILRSENIKVPLLILGFNTAHNITASNLPNVSFGIVGLEQLTEIAEKISRPQNFHLKIDTGMHRQGIKESDLALAFEIINKNKFIHLEGLCTHFSDADGSNTTFTREQILLWNSLCEKAKKQFPNIKYFHAANTAGNFFHNEIFANVSRLGLGLYGINTSPHEQLALKPALEMKSTICSVKELGPEDTVGYNNTFTAKQPIKLATIPAGYFEGMNRRLSNIGYIKIHDSFCPIIGRVSMNILSANVTAVPNAKMGTPVTLISSNPKDKNSVESIAGLCGSIPHEILVHIPGHLRRLVK